MLQECIIELSAPAQLDLRSLSDISTLKLLDLSPCRKGVHVPHVDFLHTRLPHCRIIPLSHPVHSQIHRTFRAGIEGIFREWISKVEMLGES